MPFPEQIPRAFIRANIEAITPGLIGVYGLFRGDQWIYVGKGDIRQRLLAHFNGDNPLINKYQPTHWVDEVTGSDPFIREKQLILECNPACNQKVG